MLLKLNTARNRVFSFIGQSVTSLSVTISKDSGAFAAINGSGIFTISDNYCYVTLDAADTNTLGDLAYKFVDNILGVVKPDQDFIDEIVYDLPGRIADNITHGGSSAALTLDNITVYANSGPAIQVIAVDGSPGLEIQSTGTAILLEAQGTDAGIAIYGGGPGISIYGGDDSGIGPGIVVNTFSNDAIQLYPQDGVGIHIAPILNNASNLNGMLIVGAGSGGSAVAIGDGSNGGIGLQIQSSGENAAISVTSTNGQALYMSASGGSDCIDIYSQGVGVLIEAGNSDPAVVILGDDDGIYIDCSTGAGIEIQTSSGPAILLEPTDGDGIVITPSISSNPSANGITVHTAGTGTAVRINTTNGDGILITPTDGSGVVIAPTLNAGSGADGIIIHARGTGDAVTVVSDSGQGLVITAGTTGIYISSDTAVGIAIAAETGGISVISDSGIGLQIAGNDYGIRVEAINNAGIAIYGDDCPGIYVTGSSYGIAVDSDNIGMHINASGGEGLGIHATGAITGISLYGATYGVYSYGGDYGGYLVGGDVNGLYLGGDEAGLYVAGNYGVLMSVNQDALNINENTSVDSYGRHRILSGVTKGSDLNNFEFVMLDIAGNPVTGLTVTANRSIDGGDYGLCDNLVTELSNGRYKINLTGSSDLTGNIIGLRFTATGATDLNLTLITTP